MRSSPKDLVIAKIAHADPHVVVNAIGHTDRKADAKYTVRESQCV